MPGETGVMAMEAVAMGAVVASREWLGHGFQSPEGIGFLWIRPGEQITPKGSPFGTPDSSRSGG